MTAPAGTTLTVATLTEQYRQAQVELGARTMQSAVALWALLAENPEKNQPTWLTYMLRLVQRDRAQAARYAVDYIGAYRSLQVPNAEPFLPEVPPFNIEQVVTSLQVTGPVALQRKLRQLEEQQDVPPGDSEGDEPPPRRDRPVISPASEAARVLAEGNARAAQRHVLNGGRGVIDDAIERDVAVRGYVRVTDGDPCFFCAVLASRGAVYDEDSFEDSNESFEDDPRHSAPGNQKVHDGCGCSLVPIYGPRGDDAINPLLDRTREFEKLWYDTGAKFSGSRALLEFRRAYEGRKDYRA